MAGRRKLIVVSNRGPVTYGRGSDGERVARRGGGGLVTALRSLVSHHDVVWIVVRLRSFSALREIHSRNR